MIPVEITQEQDDALVLLLEKFKKQSVLAGAYRNMEFIRSILSEGVDDRRRIKPTRECLKEVDRIIKDGRNENSE